MDIDFVSNNSFYDSVAAFGDSVFLIFNTDEYAQVPLVTIGEDTVLVNGNGLTWTASKQLGEGDSEGFVPFKITYKDIGGNIGIPTTIATDSATVSFDRTAPEIMNLIMASDNSDSDSLARVGNTVTVFLVANEQIQEPEIFISGKEANVSGNFSYWTGTRLMDEDDLEGPVSFVVRFKDPAGNSGFEVTETTRVIQLYLIEQLQELVVFRSYPIMSMAIVYRPRVIRLS